MAVALGSWGGNELRSAGGRDLDGNDQILSRIGTGKATGSPSLPERIIPQALKQTGVSGLGAPIRQWPDSVSATPPRRRRATSGFARHELGIGGIRRHPHRGDQKVGRHALGVGRQRLGRPARSWRDILQKTTPQPVAGTLSASGNGEAGFRLTQWQREPNRWHLLGPGVTMFTGQLGLGIPCRTRSHRSR